MKTVDRTGTVVDVHEDYATVEVRPEDCCTTRLSCSCCSAASKPQLIRVEPEGLEVGDIVMVSTPAYITYVGILVLFVLPLVLAVIGGWIGALVEGDSAAHGMPVIVGGVLGVLACAPVAALVNRRLSRPRNAAVRKLSGAES